MWARPLARINYVYIEEKERKTGREGGGEKERRGSKGIKKHISCKRRKSQGKIGEKEGRGSCRENEERGEKE